MLLLDGWSRSEDTADTPTLGQYVIAWIHAHCRHGSGDMLGKRVELTDLEQFFIIRLYELKPSGRRRVRRALLGLTKGSRKTDLVSWLGLAELAGPVRFDHWELDERTGVHYPYPRSEADPEVILFANSKEQAKRMQERAANVVASSPYLAALLKVEQQGITFRDPNRPGVLKAVAAEAGTADGYLFSAAFGDELHDMIQRRKDLHGKIRNGVTKRPDACVAGITTAGDPHVDSVARDEYEHLKQLVAATADEVGQWVAIWRTCDAELLATAAIEVAREVDPELWTEVQAARRAAAVQANPEPWKDIDAILAQLDEPGATFGSWARYYLNAWITQDDSAFVRAGAWDARSAAANGDRIAELVELGELVIEPSGRPVPAPGTKVWLGFDGSRSRDSTALVGVTESRFAFVVKIWEATPDPDWTVPEHDVDATVRDTFARLDVQTLLYDPWGSWGDRWAVDWAYDLGTDRVLANPMGRERSSPQVIGLWRGIHADDEPLLHDGDATMHRHIHNCLMEQNRYGALLAKRGGSDSVNWIDAPVALTYADDGRTKSLARRAVPKKRPQVFFPGLTTITVVDEE